MSTNGCLRSPLLSEPNSDTTPPPLGQLWDDPLPDCNTQISGYDYWGDGSLRSPELTARFWPYVSSSPAIRTTGVDPLDLDGMQIEPIAVEEGFPVEQEMDQTMKKLKTGMGERRRPNFSTQVKERLLDWLKKHRNHPYPDSIEVAQLAAANKLTVKQVRTFFVNNRIRMIRTGLRKENGGTKRSVMVGKKGNKEE
jgi:hypothetical protein